MSASHLFNIQGCIEKYADLNSARAWLRRAQGELDDNQFATLVQNTFHWLLVTTIDDPLIDNVLSLLCEFDSRGDSDRRLEIWKIRQKNLEERLAEAERRRQEDLRVRQQKLDREERERIRAEEQAAAEIERLRQERLRKAAEARKQPVLAEIDKRLESDYLSADAYFQQLSDSVVSEQEYLARKVDFVRNWIGKYAQGSGKSTKPIPDPEQLAAIAAVHGHIQVVARAGSGKTATLVNRAIFLIRHCHVDPAHVLLLAFNRKAAIEVRRRLLALIHEGAEQAIRDEIDHRAGAKRSHNRRIDWGELEAEAIDSVAKNLNVALPHVMTFHALAYGIVHPEESLLYNGAEGESQGLSRAFQTVVDDHLQLPEFRGQIRELMLAHFKEDWDRIVAGRYDQSKEELLRFRRSLPRESLAGDYVKSFGEKLIADFLFEHDITYKYERNHWWGDVNYRPDFTIFKTPKSGLIIEYFGLAGDSDYDEMSREKRVYWKNKQDWSLLEFSPNDITSGGDDVFRKLLKQQLEEQGVPCNRLTEDELWQRIRDRAIDRFTKASVNFVGRCRKQSLSPDDLREAIDAYVPLSPVESMFLALAHTLYAGYLSRLAATGEEDFDGLMQRASQAIGPGQTMFQRKAGNGDLASLRFVCIDEFQDFSDLFYRLLSAIREVNPRVELFCVGDDWQAINGFAGSDLRFFERFNEYIGRSQRLYISTNYRSSKAIVDIGNHLMTGLGKPAGANKASLGKVVMVDSAAFRPSLIENQRYPGDIITPMVTRIANKSLVDGSDVVMLSRRNALPWFFNVGDQSRGQGRGLSVYLDMVRSLFPKGLRERISISTAHKYKGLEKSTVIVMDAVARSYPLIHPDWAFSRILGDTLEKITKEERRLFYVALTRAIDRLVIIADSQSRSPFMDELCRSYPFEKIEWDEYPPIRSTSSRLVVKIGNQVSRGSTPTYAIKDLLKASGYEFQAAGWPGWAKSFPIDGFRLDLLISELWASEADGVEVRVYDETDVLVAKILNNAGKWTTVTDKLAQLVTTEIDYQQWPA
jgi:DNA helicase-4